MLRELNLNEMETVSGGQDSGWTEGDTIHGTHDPLNPTHNDDITSIWGGAEGLTNSILDGLNESGGLAGAIDVNIPTDVVLDAEQNRRQEELMGSGYDCNTSNGVTVCEPIELECTPSQPGNQCT